MSIHDAARDEPEFIRASCAFGHLVWDFGRHDDALWKAGRCGEFVAHALPAAREEAWSLVERAMNGPRA